MLEQQYHCLATTSHSCVSLTKTRQKLVPTNLHLQPEKERGKEATSECENLETM